MDQFEQKLNSNIKMIIKFTFLSSSDSVAELKIFLWNLILF